MLMYYDIIIVFILFSILDVWHCGGCCRHLDNRLTTRVCIAPGLTELRGCHIRSIYRWALVGLRWLYRMLWRVARTEGIDFMCKYVYVQRQSNILLLSSSSDT